MAAAAVLRLRRIGGNAKRAAAAALKGNYRRSTIVTAAPPEITEARAVAAALSTQNPFNAAVAVTSRTALAPLATTQSVFPPEIPVASIPLHFPRPAQECDTVLQQMSHKQQAQQIELQEQRQHIQELKLLVQQLLPAPQSGALLASSSQAATPAPESRGLRAQALFHTTPQPPLVPTTLLPPPATQAKAWE